MAPKSLVMDFKTISHHISGTNLKHTFRFAQQEAASEHGGSPEADARPQSPRLTRGSAEQATRRLRSGTALNSPGSCHTLCRKGITWGKSALLPCAVRLSRQTALCTKNHRCR